MSVDRFAWARLVMSADGPVAPKGSGSSTAALRLVLVAIATVYADRATTLARPGQDALAEAVGAAVRALRRTLALAVDLGWLAVIEAGGSGRATVYRLASPAGVAAEQVRTPEESGAGKSGLVDHCPDSGVRTSAQMSSLRLPDTGTTQSSTRRREDISVSPDLSADQEVRTSQSGTGAGHPTAKMEAQYNPANSRPELSAALLRIRRAEAVGLVKPDEFQRNLIRQAAGAVRRGGGWLKPIQVETVHATADQIEEDPVDWLSYRVRSLGLAREDTIRLLDWWVDLHPRERHDLTPIAPGQPAWEWVGAERLGLRLNPPVSPERHEALCEGCSSRSEVCLIGRALGLESLAARA